MKISTTIFVGFAVILLLFSVTTLVNYRQSQQVAENSEWVSKSQMVIRNTSRYQRNVIDMESSLRGFLLTGEDKFLEQYDSAKSENDVLYKELIAMLPYSSVRQRKKLAGIQQMHNRWQKEFAGPLVIARKDAKGSPQAATFFQLLYNDKTKNRTEKIIGSWIRDEFRDVNNAEYELREARKQTLSASVANTRTISFTLTSMSIILGIAIALYINFVISRRIRQMVQLADCMANGDFRLIRDTAKDELSRLSHSLNRMATTLNENITELERKNMELDRFTYVVSHDLKAPLRGVENVSYLIEEDFGDELPPKVLDYLSMIKGRIRRMENLIGGLLALSRVGKDKKIVEQVNVELLVKEIIEMLSPDTGFRFMVQAEMPVLYTERIPLQQVFTNLISNAIKYHHRSSGEVKILCREKATHYEFSVIDDGPGIEPKYHQKIFIIFQTLKERDAFESTGVGLAIVKKILDDKKCTIRIISDLNQGAAFCFTWPKTMQV